MSSVDEKPGTLTRCHFTGVAGSGMSALAQYHVFSGGRGSGSDRVFDRGEADEIRRTLEASGVAIVPQDGRGPAADCHAVVTSGAVESSVSDIQMARRRGIPVLHRSEFLARHIEEKRTIAVAGTSGKSTVSAMIFEILRSAGRDPSLITGGNLISLRGARCLGNAWLGGSDLLVVEADESDGSLVRYEPWMGVLLNIRRDHREPEELARLFTTFRERTKGPFLIGEDVGREAFGDPAAVFGFGPESDLRAEDVVLDSRGARFTISGEPFELRVAGLHNVWNAVAAAAACRQAGVELSRAREALAKFRGVARRFQVIGRARGVEVVDDFAHNPDKIAASLATARGRGKRILAVFQPHGFGPTRFMRDELVEVFASRLRATDRLRMAEIYYAGGTVSRDISSRDIVDALTARGIEASYVDAREDLVGLIAEEARDGDIVLVMGARDPSLAGLSRRILGSLTGSRSADPQP